MKSKVVSAKNELYDDLMHYQEVVGASVRQSKGHWYIVILLSKLSAKIVRQIPTRYKGTLVKHEVTGKITSR